MKYIKILVLAVCLLPFGAARAAGNDEFMVAAQLLAAARHGDIQYVQNLVNNGADINYVDSTGLSLVCTALMNNDIKAAQILQMYGADASQCDRQIKKYNSRNKPKTTGGLFSGLSSAQSLTLAAAGAAVVIGGLFLLTDVFDPDNGNDTPASSDGNRPGGDGGTVAPTVKPAYTVPYGPAFITTDGKLTTSYDNYNATLAGWLDTTANKLDFDFLRPNVQPSDNFIVAGITVPLQNYLLMMHGYSAFAYGYNGQRIFRDSSLNPVKMLNTTGGGRPVQVSLITENGVNPTGSAGRGDGISYADSVAVNAQPLYVDKYLNYANPTDGVLGGAIAGFDFSGSGTAMNPFASANDSALAKIVGGWAAGGRSGGDLYGFVPYGQLAIFRTGGGNSWVDVSNPTSGDAVGMVGRANTSTAVSDILPGDVITLNGKTYAISDAIADFNTTVTVPTDTPSQGTDAPLADTIVINGQTYVVSNTAVNTDTKVMGPTITINNHVFTVAENDGLLKGKCTDEDCDDVIALYRGTDGFYYVNTTGGNRPDAVYVVNKNKIYEQKTYQSSSIKTFETMFQARQTALAASQSNERLVDVVLANLSVNPESRKTGYLTMDGFRSLLGATGDARNLYRSQVNEYYEKTNAATTQGDYANNMFNQMFGGSKPSFVIMPAGDYAYGQGDGKSLVALDATFENYAPAIYDSLNSHTFMTVVAVQHLFKNDFSGGTDAADSIGAYGNGTGASYGKIALSVWGTGENYSSRKCGIAGMGINGIDPWCFAAAGPTAEMATASAAGAVAAVKGAFDYMDNGTIFTLLALTADGPYLGTMGDGTAFNADTLTAYLKDMYYMPNNNLTGAEYLRAFSDMYGYGLINLERAMMPGKSIYFYNGKNIVSGDGNAFWRAASQTAFRTSGVFGGRGVEISAPFFDVVQSVDGNLSVARVWKNEFTLGANDRRGLYMGDVLGELKTRSDTNNEQNVHIGNFGVSMSQALRPYADNMGGLDTLRFSYDTEHWNLTTGYQRYFTDGGSRFDGMANPVLNLASNAIVSDAQYSVNNWTFGGRAFSGSITTEGLLDQDPTLSAQFTPARLGDIMGAQSMVGFHGNKFDFNTAVGMMHETNTLLGAQTSGLLSLGAGDTTYIDAQVRIMPMAGVKLTGRATFARTTSNAAGDFILGLDNIDSDAYALGLDMGNFSFTVSRPLAVRRGGLRYAYAEYEINEMENGGQELAVIDTHIADLSLRPDVRETRFMGSYRHALGEFTDGALGFVYRVNPNNTSEFGNESIFMMKLTHRLGI